MDQRAMMNKLDAILDDAQAAVLATVDANGRPRLRWMTPIILNADAAVIYAVTPPQASKINDLHAHPQVEWMIQSKPLDEVANVRGVISVIDNPALKREVMSALGPRLKVFWNINITKTDFVVLETRIQQVCYYHPMKSDHVRVQFS